MENNINATSNINSINSASTIENLDDTSIVEISADPTQSVVEATEHHIEPAEVLDIGTTEAAEADTHIDEDLIPNDTTFNELLAILRANPRNAAAAQIEAEEQEREAREAQLREELGDDYDVVFVSESEDGYDKVAEQVAKFYRPKRRPGAIQLRASEKRIAKFGLGSGCFCEVFANGYAIYDNGNRKSVIWVESCGTATYYFTPLRANELEYMSQKEYIGLDVLGDEPWYTAIIMRGEEQIISNMEHPKSKGTASDSDDPSDWEDKGTYRWSAGAHFDSPEVAYLKKEAREERRKLLTDKQWEAYVMYFEEGLNQYEIARLLGISRTSVESRIELTVAILKENVKKFF